DFGDGGSSTAPNPSHTYNTPGTYSVALTVTNSAGSDTLTETDYIVVTAPPPPVAEFEADTTSGFTPLTVNFTDLSQNAPTSWSWTFGDGGTSTEQNPSHTYHSAGTYTVTLTATNANGSDPETKTDYIVVTNPPPPVADFSADTLSGQAPLTVNFSDLTSNNPTSWSWTFGDGGTSTAQNPSHTYLLAGSYEVSLTASSSFGSDNETKTNYITVSQPTARFKTTAYEVSETGGPNVTVTVELTGPYGAPISVNYATSDDSAVAPDDYSSRSGTLEFPANVTEQSFTVPIVDDTDPENTESLNLTLSGPSASAPSSATITIFDDDTPPVVRFNQSQYNINENNGTADVAVELSHPYHTEITVAYSSANGTAVSGSDYTAVADTLTFTPGGPTSQTISVPLLNDLIDEDDESFTLTLANPTVAALGSPAATIVNIADDDPAPNITFTQVTTAVSESSTSAMVTVVLSAASARTVTVDYASSDGTAMVNDDYTNVSGTLTFLPGETSQAIPFTIINDLLDEAEESFSISLTSAQNGNAGAPITINIIDDDLPPEINFGPITYNSLENSGPVLVTAQLSAPSGRTVNATYAATGGTATSGTDYAPVSGQISFAPGEVSSSFTVTPLDDNIEEGSETIELALSAVQNGSIGPNGTATVTILDDEGPPTFQFSASSFSALEGQDFATLTVILSGSSTQTIEIGYASTAGTAAPGDDYQSVNDTLSFSPGVSSLDIQVPLVNNNISEGDESFTVTLSNISGGTPGVTLTAEVIISDDDPLPAANLVSVPQNVNEDVGSVTLTAQLSAVSEQTVELEFTTSSTANASAVNRTAYGKITFAPGELSKDFQVAIPDDSMDEPDELLTVSLINPINATVGAQGSAQITVKDDDQPVSIAFSAAQFAVNEGAGSAAIDVVLSAPSGHIITVNVESADLTAEAGSDYQPVNTTLTFLPGVTTQQFVVLLQDDNQSETGEQLNLILKDVSQANLQEPFVTTLTIIDNDGNILFLPMIN
ncbi:MAG: Calx-beta domain-containing protein, partial [Candidatus Promineifilaceae bacterium]|nr:Calx-beta domain-containing protein [Candidatus Promineifilaceae bacterium]